MQKQIVKLVITGPVNAGKTTMVQHLSEKQIAATDVAATDSVSQLKALTTVGLDFGILHIDEGLELHLFGTPGQSRFNFMWDILSKGSVGAVFLVDSTSEDSMSEMKKMYDYYQKKICLPAIIGATKQDLNGAKTIDEIAELLGLNDILILPVDVREKEQSKVLALTLLESAIDGHQDSECNEFDRLSQSNEFRECREMP